MDDNILELREEMDELLSSSERIPDVPGSKDYEFKPLGDGFYRVKTHNGTFRINEETNKEMDRLLNMFIAYTVGKHIFG